MVVLNQFTCRPVNSRSVIQFHTVQLYIPERAVYQHYRHSRVFRGFEKSAVQTYGKHQNSVHFSVQQELQIFFFDFFIVTRIANQHSITVFVQLLPQIMKHVADKQALNVINKHSNRFRAVCDQPARQLIHFIMQLLYRLLYQFPVPRKDVSAIKILGNCRQG